MSGQQKIYKQIINIKNKSVKLETQKVFSIYEESKEKVLDKEIFKSLKEIALSSYETNLKRLQDSYISFDITLNGTIITVDLVEVNEKLLL